MTRETAANCPRDQRALEARVPTKTGGVLRVNRWVHRRELLVDYSARGGPGEAVRTATFDFSVPTEPAWARHSARGDVFGCGFLARARAGGTRGDGDRRVGPRLGPGRRRRRGRVRAERRASENRRVASDGGDGRVRLRGRPSVVAGAVLRHHTPTVARGAAAPQPVGRLADASPSRRRRRRASGPGATDADAVADHWSLSVPHSIIHDGPEARRSTLRARNPPRSASRLGTSRAVTRRRVPRDRTRFAGPRPLRRRSTPYLRRSEDLRQNRT